MCADYLAALRASRTFNCPDCVDAMAEAFGASAAVNHLRVRSSSKHSQTFVAAIVTPPRYPGYFAWQCYRDPLLAAS